jgi:ribonuclease HII
MGQDLWKFENQAFEQGFSCVAGIDEAGRGPLAGPVVSAAVILPRRVFPFAKHMDSKKLSARQRGQLFAEIYGIAVSVGIGIVDNTEIDRINILNAALLSMSMAVDNLCPAPDYLLIDGTFAIPFPLPQNPIIKGDALSISIGCASIIAKVTRDRLMERYHEDFPEYGFNVHKGYPTKLHKIAIREHGHCMIHRKTFKGVKEVL